MIGVDKYGNKYYENRRYFFGRSRWIIYNDEKYHLDYDGSQVPAEWYGWLHYKTDLPPTVVRETSSTNILYVFHLNLFSVHQKPPVTYDWVVDHTENLSGTSGAWVPYSTTKPKIQAWDPNAKKA